MVSVLQLVDSLAVGGLERVAVDLANGLAADHRSHLCASRRAGPLAREIDADVDTLILRRRWRFDLAAVARLSRWIAERDIEIVHAHGSALLLANLLRRRRSAEGGRRPALVWHDHYGRHGTDERNVALFRLLTRRVDVVLSVTEPLRDWAVERLRVPADRCVYLPNSVPCPPEPPARPGKTLEDATLRVICVANLRPQKNHPFLLRAFAEALHRRPDLDLHLQIVGGSPDQEAVAALEATARDLGVADRTALLGERNDVGELLQRADIGVLSSSSEGLPLALLEYGAAALPVVSTAVGQIPQVVGRNGDPAALLVPPESVDDLSAGLIRLADDAAERRDLGRRLHRIVRDHHSRAATVRRLEELYQGIRSGSKRD